MPIVTVDKLLRPEHIVEFLSQYLEQSEIPLEYVAKYDEPLLPKYPAVQIMSAPFDKQLHGTHTWSLTLRAIIYVMHARMTESRRTRNYEDLLLATQVVEYLESDLKLGGRVIHSWVESETPGAVPPRTSRGAAVVSTRLTWFGVNEARF